MARQPGRQPLGARTAYQILAAALAGGFLLSTTPLAQAASPGHLAAAGGTGATGYAPGTPSLATISNGANAAPWNEAQGDPASPAYASQAPGTLLPVYTPGGATTGSGATAEPNVAVYPGAGSGTDGVAPYPSGAVGTPGPLSGYCGTGTFTTETAGAPARQPAGSTLPLAPAYFPHIQRNADGSLTGYFDYRPKDADESIVAGTSTDNGKSWTYQGQALEQNPGYCPAADVNDDGQGHANVLTIGGVSRLYTLQRPAGDNQGVGMLVHTLTASGANPLAGLPVAEKVGIDPDAFATSATGVPFTGGTPVSIPLTQTGTASSPEQLVAGQFVDLTRTPVPSASSVIVCSGVGGLALTGCTTKVAGGLAVAAGDLIEQVLATVSTAATIPAGPNTTNGDGGLGTLSVTFASQVNAAIYNANAPNRAYVDGLAVYCSQANASPTTKMENCTTGPGGSTLAAAVGDPVTSDPIIPAAAGQTSGLVAPDGIVGVLPSYPTTSAVPAGATFVAYTQKLLNYYIGGVFTGGKTAFKSGTQTINFFPTPTTALALGQPGVTLTVVMGDLTRAPTSTVFVPVTCGGWTTSTAQVSGQPTDNLNSCTVPSQYVGDQYDKNAWFGAPGAAEAAAATLAETGEGSATNAQKLFKNNEDLTELRVAWTTDGVTFSSAGLANGGVISGASNGATSYGDISNPTAASSPPGIKVPVGSPDTPELRYIGSAGSILTNPDGSDGMFLSGSWAADGDSDAFNQIFYTSSTDGENWSIPVPVVDTDYTFSASAAQDAALAGGSNQPLGISAYYSGRAYGPTVVPNPDGTLTMLFAGYRLPKPIMAAGSVVGTNPSAPYTVGATDPALYRNILEETLTRTTSPRVATTTGLTSSANPSTAGDTVTFTATVAPVAPGSGIPTGAVTFSGNGGTLCGGVALDATGTARCQVTYTVAGADSVMAAYAGDGNYGASTSPALAQVINPIATTTNLGVSPAASVVGQPVTYTATVTSPAGTLNGTVTFTGTGAVLCSAVAVDATGTARCVTAYPAAGSDSVTATYSGDPSHGASTSAAVGETIVPASTTTGLTSSAGTVVVGQPVTFTATVAAVAPGAGTPTGMVRFTGKAGLLCSAPLLGSAPDIARCRVSYSAPGTDAVTATYVGDANFHASVSGPIGLTVKPAGTTTSLSSSANPAVTGQPLTITATVSAAAPGSGTPSGQVVFTLTEPGLGSQPACQGGNTQTLAGGIAHCVIPAGILTPLRSPVVIGGAYVPGSTSAYTGSAGQISVPVVKDATKVTIASSANPSAALHPVLFTATVAANPPGNGVPSGSVTFKLTSARGASVPCVGPATLNGAGQATCLAPALTASGSPYTLTVTYGGDSLFAASTGTFLQGVH